MCHLESLRVFLVDRLQARRLSRLVYLLRILRIALPYILLVVRQLYLLSSLLLILHFVLLQHRRISLLLNRLYYQALFQHLTLPLYVLPIDHP